MPVKSVPVLFVIFLTLSSLCGTQVFAAFPPRIMVKFREKMSCRDVKKLLKPNHLFVNCQANSMRSVSYSAEYLGSTPLPQIISTLTSNAKVLTVSPDDGPISATEDTVLAPTAASTTY